MTLKPGTRIEVRQAMGVLEAATILRWTKAMGNRDRAPGYHLVSYDNNGGRMMVHEDCFRVIDS
jgi:hypothetical protein